MMNKAEKRKREEGKNTVFSYGGKLWNRERVENTLSRAKKARFSDDGAGKLDAKSYYSMTSV